MKRSCCTNRCTKVLVSQNICSYIQLFTALFTIVPSSLRLMSTSVPLYGSNASGNWSLLGYCDEVMSLCFILPLNVSKQPF